MDEQNQMQNMNMNEPQNAPRGVQMPSAQVPQASPEEPKKSHAGLFVLLGIVIIVIIGGLVWLFTGEMEEVRTPSANDLSEEVTTEPGAPAGIIETGDTTAEIEQDLQGVDLGDLDGEFQTIDSDLEQL